MDKTGTLTKGKPELTAVHNISQKTDDEIIHTIASLEKYSEHPIAEAIVSYATQKNISLETVKDFISIK
jgi:cation transport ATPase